ncbi:MAG: hypothetical protein AAGI49_09260 [Bacteroidota bacterium]
MKTSVLILLIVTCFALSNCEKEIIIYSTNQLFPNTQPLDVQYAPDEAGLPTFDISEVPLERLYIGIFEEAPIVKDGEIVNTGSLVWHWHSGKAALQTVDFGDGTIDDTTYTAENIACATTDSLFWAAWAWRDEYISHSTSPQTFAFQPVSSAKIAIEKIAFESNQDGLFTAGEELQLNVFLENIGSQKAEAVYLEISHPDMVGLPATHLIPMIAPNAMTVITFPITLPENLSFGDSLLLNIQVRHSECVVEPVQYHPIVINGRQLYLKRVKLLKISSNPDPWSVWDPFKVLPYSNPDPYFVLTTNVADTLYLSSALSDVDSNNPNVAWAILNPTLPLNLDRDYAIKVFDNDPDTTDPDDLIGDVLLSPMKLLEDANDVEIIRSSSIWLQLELVWR